MTAQAPESLRFVRKTQLAPDEYHRNFHQLDDDVILAITSPEADRVTPLMSKIYLRLTTAPARYWERDGVLRFEAEVREGKHVKAWSVLCEVLGVASATASKALTWMSDVGVIGYFSGKNGVGLRIFINRAANSIGSRAVPQGSKKILAFAPASGDNSPASRNEPAFKDSFAVSDVLDPDLNPRAPKNGADTKPLDKIDPDPTPPLGARPHAPNRSEGREEGASRRPGAVSVGEIVERLKAELEPCVKAAATQAAAQTAARETARTREWFETRALPKAVRVAQRETYDLLRKHGTLDERSRRARADLEVGRAAPDPDAPTVARKLTPEEIRETAETCVALLETQGKSIDVTLSEISSEGGGWLLPEDAPRVRRVALSLLSERNERR